MFLNFKIQISHHSIAVPGTPVGCDWEVSALVDDPRRLVHLQGRAGVLLTIPVAVGALVLVEDVGRELAALVLPHFVVFVVVAVVVVKTVIGVSSFAF
jgi:hypothetical protein